MSVKKATLMAHFEVKTIFSRYPFTAPAVMPFTSLSCRIVNRMIIGRTASTSTASIIGIFKECSPLKLFMAIGNVCDFVDCVRVLTKTNSFQ